MVPDEPWGCPPRSCRHVRRGPEHVGGTRHVRRRVGGLLRGERDHVVVVAVIIASDFGAEDAYEARVVALADFGPGFVVYWHRPVLYEADGR